MNASTQSPLSKTQMNKIWQQLDNYEAVIELSEYPDNETLNEIKEAKGYVRHWE